MFSSLPGSFANREWSVSDENEKEKIAERKTGEKGSIYLGELDRCQAHQRKWNLGLSLFLSLSLSLSPLSPSPSLPLTLPPPSLFPCLFLFRFESLSAAKTLTTNSEYRHAKFYLADNYLDFSIETYRKNI